MSDIERTALKEWAVLVDAMGRGDIIAMVRKGGIREHRAGFAVRHDRFLFYPTYFHENVGHLAERFHPTLHESHARRPPAGRVRIASLAEVLAVWKITDPALLPRIADEHGLAPEAVESRFHYRGTPYVRLIAVRILALAEPAQLPEAPRYAGCVSWLELDTDVSVENARAVVAEPEIRRRLAALAETLGPPEREPA